MSFCKEWSWNCPLFRFFLLLFFSKQILSEFEGYIVSAAPYYSKQEWDFEMGCYKPVKCVLLIYVTKSWRTRPRGLQSARTVFTVVLAQRGITNWSFQEFRPLILMKLLSSSNMLTHPFFCLFLLNGMWAYFAHILGFKITLIVRTLVISCLEICGPLADNRMRTLFSEGDTFTITALIHCSPLHLQSAATDALLNSLSAMAHMWAVCPSLFWPHLFVIFPCSNASISVTTNTKYSTSVTPNGSRNCGKKDSEHFFYQFTIKGSSLKLDK